MICVITVIGMFWLASPQQILTTAMTRQIIVDKRTDHTKPHSIVFYHNIKNNERNLCQDLLTIENTNSDLKVCALHYGIMQIRYLYVSDFPFKTFYKLAQHAETIQKKMFGKRLMTQSYLLSIRVQTTINHISFRFTSQYQC